MNILQGIEARCGELENNRYLLSFQVAGLKDSLKRLKVSGPFSQDDGLPMLEAKMQQLTLKLEQQKIQNEELKRQRETRIESLSPREYRDLSLEKLDGIQKLFPQGVSTSSKAYISKWGNAFWCSCPVGPDDKRIELIKEISDQVRARFTQDQAVKITEFCSGGVLFAKLLWEKGLLTCGYQYAVINLIDANYSQDICGSYQIRDGQVQRIEEVIEQEHLFTEVLKKITGPGYDTEDFSLAKTIPDFLQNLAHTMPNGGQLDIYIYQTAAHYVAACQQNGSRKSHLLLMVDPGGVAKPSRIEYANILAARESPRRAEENPRKSIAEDFYLFLPYHCPPKLFCQTKFLLKNADSQLSFCSNKVIKVALEVFQKVFYQDREVVKDAFLEASKRESLELIALSEPYLEYSHLIEQTIMQEETSLLYVLDRMIYNKDSLDLSEGNMYGRGNHYLARTLNQHCIGLTGDDKERIAEDSRIERDSGCSTS